MHVDNVINVDIRKISDENNLGYETDSNDDAMMLERNFANSVDWFHKYTKRIL